MKVTKELLEAIAVTAELTSTDLSENAARFMADDLSQYPEQQVLKALTKCRRELKGRLTVEAVISRIDDGRPGAEEAWAMIPKDELGSVVWTQEMSEAYGIANALIQSGDRIQARMAFIESYRNGCEKARNNGVKVQWFPSLGHDPNGRESVLMDAVEKGRLTAKHAAGLLPHREGSELINQLLSSKKDEVGLKKLEFCDVSQAKNVA